MFVEVVRFWAKGECFDRNGLLIAQRSRGYLNVHQRFDHWTGRDVYVARLTLGGFASTAQLLPTLDQVRIGKLKGNDFVLLGIEDLSRRKVTALFPQTWCCQVIPTKSSLRVLSDEGDVL